MNRNGDIPLPGPNLDLPTWTKVVTYRVRDFLGTEVRAIMRQRIVVWTYGRAEARLDATRDYWWLTVSSSTGTGTGISTHSDRHDRHTAEITAANIVIHFESRFCRGLDVTPYTEHELQMITKGK